MQLSFPPRVLPHSTYHLRSNDYHSSRNYASRLIGNKLIFYAPERLSYEDLSQSFPAVRKWHKGASESEFKRIVPASRVYRPEGDFDFNYGGTLLTVTVCDLANGGFDCQATSVIGPPGHVFYVSPDSVYVWASTWGSKEQNRSIVFRLPLDGSGPSALRVSGSPVDQFSFLQSEDQYLNVLVQSTVMIRACWGFRSASPVGLVTNTCLKTQPRFCFYETTRYSFARSASLVHCLRKLKTIGVARRVLIGMEMRDRCFCVGGCSRCLDMKLSRAGWMMVECMSCGE